MTRLFLPLLAVMTPVASLAQTVVPVHEEPMHRLVHEEPEFRILDVQIPTGDTTLFHRHESPIAFVAINSSPVNIQVLGGTWRNTASTSAPPFSVGQVWWNESYAHMPVTHRVTTVGRVLFRLIAVVSRGPGNPEEGQPSLGSAGPVTQEGRWFRSAKRTIESARTLQWVSLDRPVITVQVSDGVLSVETPGGASQEIDGAGAFVVLVPGQEYTLRNRGSGPVTVVLVEVR